ncbi:NAD-dependent epimerase/dehydratase family protein [Foetidibacter luteolus]|uniref:NAD-dependent epimerase/dehydratase family protein n=1 Tax=Foetidibacter luteolus TaxID=2608880 RepID=UPI00129BE4AA|nr:NAD(P)-dependent oxidoreductase [Foetidibacter luteolus]
MKQKILITGASGFVGFHLVNEALARRLDVYAAVRKSSDIKHLQHLPITYTYPDFGNIASLQKELEEKQYDYIIHAAGTTKAKSEADYTAINADYTYNLFKAAECCSPFIKKIVFLSSLASIGPLQQPDSLITESTPPRPVTAYGRSKLLAEQQVAQLNIPLNVLRPTAVYGPRDKDIFILFKALSRGLEPYIGRVQQQLSFIYVKDLAVLALNAIFAPAVHQTYNVTDGNSYSRYDLANLTKPLLYKKTLRFHLPLGVVRVLALALEKTYVLLNKTPALNREKLSELTAVNWCCNIEKAQNELGFTPAYNLEKGLAETMSWYKQEKWL